MLLGVDVQNRMASSTLHRVDSVEVV